MCSNRLTERDKRLLAGLILLRDNLAPVIDELTWGELNPDTRRRLARGLRSIADDLEQAPVVVVNDERSA